MPPETTSLLEAAGIDAGYGTMQVLWGVDLDVRAGVDTLRLQERRGLRRHARLPGTPR